MLYLDTLTSVADSHILRNGMLHSTPPELFLQIVIHLRAARMNGICRIMSLTQDQLPEVCYIRHTYPALVPQGTLIILSEMRGFANLQQFTDLLQLLIIFLMLPDLGL
jgi:hypothetical protein